MHWFAVRRWRTINEPSISPRTAEKGQRKSTGQLKRVYFFVWKCQEFSCLNIALPRWYSGRTLCGEQHTSTTRRLDAMFARPREDRSAQSTLIKQQTGHVSRLSFTPGIISPLGNAESWLMKHESHFACREFSRNASSSGEISRHSDDYLFGLQILNRWSISIEYGRSFWYTCALFIENRFVRCSHRFSCSSTQFLSMQPDISKNHGTREETSIASGFPHSIFYFSLCTRIRKARAICSRAQKVSPIT